MASVHYEFLTNDHLTFKQLFNVVTFITFDWIRLMILSQFFYICNKKNEIAYGVSILTLNLSNSIHFLNKGVNLNRISYFNFKILEMCF